jgi:hypothetical protein
VFYALGRLIEWADQLIEADEADPIAAAEEILSKGDD